MSCTPQTTPATTPTLAASTLHMYATSSTHSLVLDLATAYSETHPEINIGVTSVNDTTDIPQPVETRSQYVVTVNADPAQFDWIVPIAQDAIVLLIDPDTTLSDVSVEQIRAIYQGRISNWEVVTETIGPIIPVSREMGSDLRTEFERLVMGQSRIMAGVRILTSDQQMAAFVGNTSGAVGYVSLGSITDASAVIPLDGVIPSVESVMQGIYPLRTTIYLAGQRPRNAQERTFVNWVQGIEGQRVVSRRYVPLLPVTFEGD